MGFEQESLVTRLGSPAPRPEVHQLKWLIKSGFSLHRRGEPPWLYKAHQTPELAVAISYALVFTQPRLVRGTWNYRSFNETQQNANPINLPPEVQKKILKNFFTIRPETDSAIFIGIGL